MWRLLLGCLLATQFSYVQAAPENDPWLVLQKAAQAARELSYQGVFLYQSGNSSRSVQITHMNYGQGEYARIVVLDGTPREVLSQGNDVVIFSPRNEKVVIEKRRLVERNSARNYVTALQTYCTAPYDFDVTRLAWRIEETHGFGWWDCMLLASASIARCDLFLSEDMQHGRRVGDMTIASPFMLGPAFDLSR